MDTYRKVEFSTHLFNGYCVWLDISKYENKSDLIHDAKVHLTNFFKTFNLKHLYEYAKNTNIGLESYQDCNEILLRTSPKDTIYLYEERERHSI